MQIISFTCHSVPQFLLPEVIYNCQKKVFVVSFISYRLTRVWWSFGHSVFVNLTHLPFHLNTGISNNYFAASFTICPCCRVEWEHRYKSFALIVYSNIHSMHSYVCKLYFIGVIMWFIIFHIPLTYIHMSALKEWEVIYISWQQWTNYVTIQVYTYFTMINWHFKAPAHTKYCHVYMICPKCSYVSCINIKYLTF